MEIDMWKYGMTMMKYGPTTMKYHLTGVIVHHGQSANSGHYTAFVKCHDKQVWYHIDDTLIRWVDESILMTTQAYILIYHKTK